MPGQLPLQLGRVRGGYDYVAEALFGELDVDGFFCEFDDERSGGFAPLRFVPPGKQVVLGLVTTKTGALEDPDALKRRIDEAAKYVPLDQLCLSPQCGFSSTVEGNALTVEEQEAKLRLIVQVAADVWGERGAGSGRRGRRGRGAGGAAVRPGTRRGRGRRRDAGARPRVRGRRVRPGGGRPGRAGHRAGRRPRPRWRPLPPRCRPGTFRVGDAHDPPAGPFDVVAAVQLLAHVANPLVVLRGRAPGSARVAVTVWGREQECDVRAFGEALAPWLPPRRGGRRAAADHRAGPAAQARRAGRAAGRRRSTR